MKVREVIETILRNTPDLGEREADTVDTLKFGDPEWEVHGIATTTFPTVQVIREAAALGLDLIIAHEPAYFSHRDETGWLQGNPAFEEKQALLRKHRIAVWRFHDHAHAHRPDLIYHGVMREMGWDTYYRPDLSPGLVRIYDLPPITLRDLALRFKEAVQMNGLRLIGDPSLEVRRIAFSGGAGGANMGDDTRFTRMLYDLDIDAFCFGEMIEWNVAAHVRDASLLGQKKGIVVLGHNCGEDLGMKNLPDWLYTVLPETLPIRFVRSKDFFQYV